jgi:DNA-binding transcriptional MocR family regulator
MVISKQAVDLHTSTISQYLALGLLADGEAQAARVRASAARYGRQSEALISALRRHLGDRLELGVVDGGMFVWGHFVDQDLDTVELLQRSLGHGVAFVPGAPFFAHAPGGDEPPPSAYLRMSFATLAADQFEEAARRLAAAVDHEPSRLV